MTQPSSTDIARAIARRYCGWHVSPEDSVSVTIDGPGHRTLVLPTLHLVDLESVTEDGVELDLADLAWSERGLVVKRDGSFWTGSLGGIAVSMTHGYDTADDFDHAVAIIAGSAGSTARSDASLVRKKVDDVEYQWSNIGDPLAGTAPMLDKFRLEPSP